GGASAPQRGGGGAPGPQGQGQGGGPPRGRVQEPEQEGPAGHDDVPAAPPPAALEQLRVVLERRVRDVQRMSEDVFLGRLERLDGDEVDGEETVERGQGQEQAVPPSAAPPAHAGAPSSGGSNHRNRTKSAATSRGTRERAQGGPGPSGPPGMRSQ